VRTKARSPKLLFITAFGCTIGCKTCWQEVKMDIRISTLRIMFNFSRFTSLTSSTRTLSQVQHTRLWLFCVTSVVLLVCSSAAHCWPLLSWLTWLQRWLWDTLLYATDEALEHSLDETCLNVLLSLWLDFLLCMLPDSHTHISNPFCSFNSSRVTIHCCWTYFKNFNQSIVLFN
jgi:hypothetical protein